MTKDVQTRSADDVLGIVVENEGALNGVNVATAMMQVSKRMRDQEKRRIFEDRRFKLLLHLVHQKMGEFTAWNLSSILWAWAKMNYEDMPPDLLEQLMGATRQRMFDFKPQELKNVIWAYATMMNHPGEQFLKVSEPPLKVSSVCATSFESP